MRSSRILLVAALLLAGCSLRFNDLHECTADADCRAKRADLVCDVAANICVQKGCTESSECEALSPALVCDPAAKVCAAKSCKSHDDCAPFGSEYACHAGTCTNACFAATFSASSGQKAVKMGALLPLSADAQGTENVAVRVRRWSIELALKELNQERGGLQVGSAEARRIDFAFCDTHNDASLAGRLADHLTSDGRVALLTAGTAETQQVMTIAKPRQVLVTSVSATANSLTVDANGNPVDNGGLFRRMVPRDEFQASAMYQVIQNFSGGTPEVGVVHEHNDYGDGLEKALKNRWSADGSNVLDVAFDDTNPASANLADLGTINPQDVVFAGKPANVAAVLKNLGQTAIPHFIISDASTNQTLVDLLGSSSSLLGNAVGIEIWVDQTTQTFQDYRTGYSLLRTSNGPKPFLAYEKDGTFGPQAYDAMYTLALGWAAAVAKTPADLDVISGKAMADALSTALDGNEPHGIGRADMGAMLDELARSNGTASFLLTGAAGPVHFDRNGDVDLGAYGQCPFSNGGNVSFDPSLCFRIQPSGGP